MRGLYTLSLAPVLYTPEPGRGQILRAESETPFDPTVLIAGSLGIWEWALLSEHAIHVDFYLWPTFIYLSNL